MYHNLSYPTLLCLSHLHCHVKLTGVQTVQSKVPSKAKVKQSKLFVFASPLSYQCATIYLSKPFLFSCATPFIAFRFTPLRNMAKWLFDDPSNEISNNFIYQQEVPLCTYHPTLRLSTTEEHIQVLHQAFEKARHRLLIVSPFISIHAIENDQLVPLIRHTVQRGVDVTVYTDSSLDYDTKTNQLLSRAEEGRNILIENGATLIEVKGIHNKSLAIDNHTLIEGSFNWLSANRHKEYSRHECSIVVSSVQADEYINNLIKELESREKTFQSLSKPTINLDIDQKYPGFFTKESFNDCTEEDICRIKQKVQELGIQKTVLPPYIHKQRETFPRAYEPWCTEEKEIICELMQKTNHLSIFIECLQRTGQAIQIQIEGKNN